MDDADTGLDVLLAERRQLLSIAFRLLGSQSEAEDAVQETYARWYAQTDDERSRIRRPGAWLTTVATRICLTILDSARHRRERYVGEWLPEPLPHAALTAVGPEDPLDRVTLDDSVSMALLVVLDSLTPAERVAFVLHDVFALPFGEIGEIVGRSADATRQLASSARRRVREGRPEAAVRDTHSALVQAFRTACETGDLAGLTRLLDPEVTAVSDGGGRIRAALRPIYGADKVGRFLMGALSKRPEVVAEEREVSGEPGLALLYGGAVVGVVSVGVRGTLISDVWMVLNPDKLTAWNRANAGTAATAEHDGADPGPASPVS
jgi:RNA polymerase sigma-70 factor, ECF subfamily